MGLTSYTCFHEMCCADVCFLLLLFSLMLMSALLHLFLMVFISGIFLCFGLVCFLHFSVVFISSSPLCSDLFSHCMGSVSQCFRINSWYCILSSIAMLPYSVELNCSHSFFIISIYRQADMYT